LHDSGRLLKSHRHPAKATTPVLFVDAVCRAALKLVPHSSFTFAKLWLLAAKLEVGFKFFILFRLILSNLFYYISFLYILFIIQRCQS
jgi:hypothetical protein